MSDVAEVQVGVGVEACSGPGLQHWHFDVPPGCFVLNGDFSQLAAAFMQNAPLAIRASINPLSFVNDFALRSTPNALAFGAIS